MDLIARLPSLGTLYRYSSATYGQACIHLNRICSVALNCLYTSSAWTCRKAERARGCFSQINVSRLSKMSDTAKAYLSPSLCTASAASRAGALRVYTCISRLPVQGREVLCRLHLAGSRAIYSLSQQMGKCSDFLRSHKVAALWCAAVLGMLIWGRARYRQVPLAPPAPSSSQSGSRAPVVQASAQRGLLNGLCKVESLTTIINCEFAAPPILVAAPPVELLFCVDVSDSMKGTRIAAAEKAFKNILVEAEVQLQRKPGREIRLGVVTFTDQAAWVVKKQPLSLSLIQNLKDRVDKNTLFCCKGSTRILVGLEETLTELPTSHSGIRPSHGLVLLTDGDESLCRDHVVNAQTRLANAGTDFLVVQIRDDKIVTENLGNSLCKDSRPSSLRNLPFRAEYFEVKGSKEKDLHPIVVKISELFSRQLRQKLCIHEVTTENSRWAVDPLNNQVTVEPGQKTPLSITARCKGPSVPRTLPLSFLYIDYDGSAQKSQMEVPLTA